jgi:hypothetical protein
LLQNDNPRPTGTDACGLGVLMSPRAAGEEFAATAVGTSNSPR